MDRNLNRVRNSRSMLGAAVAVFSVMLLTAESVSGQTAVISPESSLQQTGKTYGQWSAAWWQWALPIPVHNPACATLPCNNAINHPLFVTRAAQDPAGALCGI